MLCREWGGRVGRVRSAINARLEETSFVAGATASAGVLAVTGSAIALAVTLGGSHPGATGATAARPVPHTSAPSAPAVSSPPPTPAKPRPTPKPKPTSSPALPEEAAVYTAPPASHRSGAYQGRHRMHAGGWFHGGSWSGRPGHPGRHGGPHFP